MRLKLIAAAVCASALAVALLVGGSGAGATASRAKAKDVTALFDKAVKRVRAKPRFAKAVMLEADGKPTGKGPVRKAGAIDRWRFVLDNQKTKDSPFDSVTIKYSAADGFGRIKGYREPFLEDRRISGPPKMTLAKAVARLRKTGHPEPFYNVTLRRPVGQDITPPLYIFAMGSGSYLAVNTKTGSVEDFS